MIKAVCFDLDGTLVASEQLYLESNVQAAASLGYQLTQQDFLPLVGISQAAFDVALDQLIAPDQQGEFIALTQALVTARVDSGPSLAQPGADHLLQMLIAHHVRLGLVTTSTAEATARMLQNTGWTNVFEVVITAENGRLKPAPDLYQQALNQLQLPTDQVLAVEDSGVGIQAALAAGLDCVQVLDLAPESPQALLVVPNLLALEKMFLAAFA